MTGLSVLTLAAGRDSHLRNMIEALSRSNLLPSELIVVSLTERDTDLGGAAFPIRTLTIPPDESDLPGLRLAQARNLAAENASAPALLFLDADCMPSACALVRISRMLNEHDAIVCPEVSYLSSPVEKHWAEADLQKQGHSHPVRPFPKAGWRLEQNAGLFWSVAFGIRAATFSRIGGFDAAYVGYGAEDTDFGFAAKALGIPLFFLGGAPVFHQCHAIHDPPLQHFDDIVRNAQRFRDKWKIWPMEGWLAAFAERNLIAWRPDGATIEIVRRPDLLETAASMQPAGTPF